MTTLPTHVPPSVLPTPSIATPALPDWILARMRGHFDERMAKLWGGDHLLHGRSPGPGALFLNSNDYLCLLGERALVRALREREIAGAALDTFDVEPLSSEHPLLRLPNVLATPHIGYVTHEAYQAFYQGVIEDIRGYLAGEPIRVINPDVLNSPQLRKTT